MVGTGVVVFVCCTIGLMLLPVVVPSPPIFGRTKPPTAKPLMSPARAKSRTAKTATLRDCELKLFDLRLETVCIDDSSSASWLPVSLFPALHHSTGDRVSCINERAIGQFGPYCVTRARASLAPTLL